MASLPLLREHLKTNKKPLPFEVWKRPSATPIPAFRPRKTLKKPSSSPGSPLISFLLINPLASGATSCDHTVPTSELFRERAMDYACARPGRGQTAIFAYFTLLTSVSIPNTVWFDSGSGLVTDSDSGTPERMRLWKIPKRGLRNLEENLVIAQAFKKWALRMLKSLQGVQLASWNLAMLQ